MERPTGKGQFVGGLWFLFLALICFAIALNIRVSTYPTIDTDALVMRSAMITLTGCCVGLAFLLFVTGWIIQAISFLPGKGDFLLSHQQPLLILEDMQEEPAQTDDEIQKSDPFNTFLWIATGIFIIGIIIALGSYLSSTGSHSPVQDEGILSNSATHNTLNAQ